MNAAVPGLCHCLVFPCLNGNDGTTRWDVPCVDTMGFNKIFTLVLKPTAETRVQAQYFGWGFQTASGKCSVSLPEEEDDSSGNT